MSTYIIVKYFPSFSIHVTGFHVVSLLLANKNSMLMSENNTIFSSAGKVVLHYYDGVLKC